MNDKGILESCSELLLLVIAAVVIFPLAVAIKGFVVMLLWKWLAVPVFGVHALTFWESIAVGVLFEVFTHQKTVSQKYESATEAITAFVMQFIVAPGLIVLTGWIVSTQL